MDGDTPAAALGGPPTHLSAPAVPATHANLIGQPQFCPVPVPAAAAPSLVPLQSPASSMLPAAFAPSAFPSHHSLVQQYGIARAQPAFGSVPYQPLAPSQNLFHALATYPAAPSLSGARVASAPAPAQAMLTAKAKVLLSYGGRSSVNPAGVWEYLGGETRLVGGLDPTAGFDALAIRVEAESSVRLGVEGSLRYELPGCPGTLVDVRCDEDVHSMWSEWTDFCSLSKQLSFKLHLYVVPLHSTSQHSSGSAGRGSDNLSAVLYAPAPRARSSLEGARSSEGEPGSDETSRDDMSSHTAVVTTDMHAATLPGASLAGGIAGASQPGSAPPSPFTPAPTDLYKTNHGQLLLSHQALLNDLAKVQASHSLQLAALNPEQDDRGNGGGGGGDGGGGKAGGSQYQSSCTSFDRLLTRVKNSVEIIRPADLRIIRFMGSGGFADCYLAKWLGVEVAVKCLRDLPGAHSSSKASIKELLREASILSGMRHPNVLCLYAVALPDELAIQYGVRPAPVMTPGSPHRGGTLDTLDTPHPHPGHVPLEVVMEEHDSDMPGGVDAGEPLPSGLQLAQSDPGCRPTRFSDLSLSAVAANLKQLSLTGQLEPDTPRDSSRESSRDTRKRGGGSTESSGHQSDDGQGSSSKGCGGTRGMPTPPTSPFAEAASATPFQWSPGGGHAKGLTPTSSAGSRDTGHTAGGDKQVPSGAASHGSSAKSHPMVPEPSFGTITNSISFGFGSTRTASSSNLYLELNSAASPAVASEGMGGVLESAASETSGHGAAAAAAAAAAAPAGADASPPASPSQHQVVSKSMYNTDEDETIRKAVQAAEAAAAFSADVESQTAVSEGLITRPALVAEFLSGCSLGSAIKRKADFLASGLVLAKVAMDASRGMEYCHAKRITHWNLKTGNLIVGFTSAKVPICKVADMGLSSPRQLCELDDAGVARVLPWAAPELVRSPDTATEKVDVYSFGMILWSMWARHHPFDRQDIARVFLRTMQGHQVRPPIPGTPEWCVIYPDEPSPAEPVPGWCDLMQRCWAQSPAARPPFSEVSRLLINMFSTAKAAKRTARAEAAKAKSAAAGAGADVVNVSGGVVVVAEPTVEGTSPAPGTADVDVAVSGPGHDGLLALRPA